MLDEVLLESAGDLLVRERGDGNHSPEFALQPLVQPVKLFIASGHLEILMFIAYIVQKQSVMSHNLNVAKIRSDWVCHESFQSSKFASFLGSPHLASVRSLAVLPNEEILKVIGGVRPINCTLVHYFVDSNF